MSMDDGRSNEAELPDWVASAFRKFMAQARHVGSITQLEIDAIRHVVLLPGYLQHFIDQGGDFSKDLKWANELASRAQLEIEAKFSNIRANSVVALWSRLESLVREFVSEWLKHHPETLRGEPFSRIRVRLGDFISWSEEERFHHLVVTYENEVGAGYKNGVDKFEELLGPLGLGGFVPKQLSRDLFEFGQVRNVLVHCGAQADRRILRDCPWLGLSLGQEIVISEEMFGRYVRCSMSYMSLLIIRFNKVILGKEVPSEEGVELLKKIMGPYFDESLVRSA